MKIVWSPLASGFLTDGFDVDALDDGDFRRTHPFASRDLTDLRAELDQTKREAILHKIQQIMVERVVYAPIWQLAFINGVGSRVAEASFGRIPA